MRVLFTIPHYFGPTADDAPRGSGSDDAEARLAAFTRCLGSLLGHFGGAQYLAHLDRPASTPANQSETAQADVLICTTPDGDLLADLPFHEYQRHRARCKPSMLGFECHALLREALGDYDYYCYLEDDLVIQDPCFFERLVWFNAEGPPAFHGEGRSNRLLMPNRYELSQRSPPRKMYVDGDVAENWIRRVAETPTFANPHDEPTLERKFLNRSVTFHRPRNPHAGCFFLTAEQMEHWTRQPYFLDRDTRFVGPLESAATLGMLRTFRIYKPAPQNANFWEVEHFSDHWTRRIDQRDLAAGVPLAGGAIDPSGASPRPIPKTNAGAAAAFSSSSPRRILIQTMMMAPGACEHVRVREPERLLTQIPGVRTLTEVKKMDPSAARGDEEKILVWQRPILHFPKSLKRLRELLRRGYLIVVEYDDDPARRPEHPANQFLTFRGCHCVQVSTEPMAEYVRQFNPNVTVFANQIAQLPPPREYAEQQQVVLFFGALHRQKDWQGVMPALNEVVAQFADRLRFEVIFDREFYDALAASDKHFTPLCPYAKYLEILGRCDVGLLPLRPTHMNRMKSDLKFIEHAAYGVAVLASPTVYERSLEEGVAGCIYRSKSEFKARLIELIEDADRRRQLAKAAYAYVRDQRQLSQHYRKRYEWYLQMRDALPWLTAQLKSRLPELA